LLTYLLTYLLRRCMQLYTDWVNHFLQKSNCSRRATDLQTDLADTQLLFPLVEAVGTLLTYYTTVFVETALLCPEGGRHQYKLAAD